MPRLGAECKDNRTGARVQDGMFDDGHHKRL